MKKVVVLLTVLALAAMSATNVAAKSSPTLTTNASIINVGDAVYFNGCGYNISSWVQLSIFGSSRTNFSVSTDEFGCFDTDSILYFTYYAETSGQYTVKAFEGNLNKAVQSLVFVVN